MDKNQSIDLLVYGLMVVGLNLVAHRIAPGFAGATLILLIAVGVLIMLLSVLGLRGFRRRSWPIVTLIVAAGLLLVLAARAWFAVKSGVDGMKPVAAILSLLLLFAVMQLVTFARPERHLPDRSGKRVESVANDDDVNDEGQKRIRPSLDDGR